MKKGFGSAVGAGSIPQGYLVRTQGSGSGSAPKCHGSPTLVVVTLMFIRVNNELLLIFKLKGTGIS
jgi:hypothetical protein